MVVLRWCGIGIKMGEKYSKNKGNRIQNMVEIWKKINGRIFYRIRWWLNEWICNYLILIQFILDYYIKSSLFLLKIDQRIINYIEQLYKSFFQPNSIKFN